MTEFPCDKCEYIANLEENLRKHKQRIHDHELKVEQHNCMECNYSSKYSRTLNAHVKTVHRGIRYDCHLCDHKSTRKAHLKEHIARRHGTESESYQCNTCEFQGKTESGLAMHTYQKHSGNIFKCEECDYQSDSRQKLSRHVM